MKKLFTLILLLGCTYLLSHAQFIGLRGGFSLSSIASSLTSSNSSNYPNNSDHYDIKSIHGFQGGIFAEFPLSTTVKWLTVETGLMIQTMGSDITFYNYKSPLGQSGWNTSVLSSDNTLTNLYYLDIPFNVKMYSSVGKTSLYFEIGPYLGIGLSGKLHDWQIRKISWGSTINNDDYKRFDSGISMGVGLKIKPILIGLSYDLGLANIYPTGDIILHNRVFSVFMEFMILHKDKSIKS